MGDSSQITVSGRIINLDSAYTPSGTPVFNCSLPTHRKYSMGEEQIEETTWHRIAVFGPQAEACGRWLQEGSIVQVTGRLQPDRETGNPRLWEDRNGITRASYEIVAQEVTFLANIREEPADSFATENKDFEDDFEQATANW